MLAASPGADSPRMSVMDTPPPDRPDAFPQSLADAQSLSASQSLADAAMCFSRGLSIGLSPDCDIKLQGLGISEKMAFIENEDDENVYVKKVDGRVVVNGHHLARGDRVQLHNGDRVVLGYCLAFRVAIHGATGEIEMAAQEFQTLERALEEIEVDREVHEGVHIYGLELQGRVGMTKARVFLQEFARVANMVDEANQLTQEMRSRDHLTFTCELVTNLRHYETEPPECVVRLTQRASGVNLLRTIVHKMKLSDTKHNGLRHTAERLLGGGRFSSGNKDIDLETKAHNVAIWDVPSFVARLERMREIYELVKTGHEPNYSLPENDPWCSAVPWGAGPSVHGPAGRSRHSDNPGSAGASYVPGATYATPPCGGPCGSPARLAVLPPGSTAPEDSLREELAAVQSQLQELRERHTRERATWEVLATGWDGLYQDPVQPVGQPCSGRQVTARRLVSGNLAHAPAPLPLPVSFASPAGSSVQGVFSSAPPEAMSSHEMMAASSRRFPVMATSSTPPCPLSTPHFNSADSLPFQPSMHPGDVLASSSRARSPQRFRQASPSLRAVSPMVQSWCSREPSPTPLYDHGALTVVPTAHVVRGPLTTSQVLYPRPGLLVSNYGGSMPPVVALNPTHCAAAVRSLSRQGRVGSRSATPPRRILARGGRSAPSLHVEPTSILIPPSLGLPLESRQDSALLGQVPQLTGLTLRVIGWSSLGTLGDLFALQPLLPELARSKLLAEGPTGEELFALPPGWMVLHTRGTPGQTVWLRLRGGLQLPPAGTSVLVLERRRPQMPPELAGAEMHGDVPDVVHCTLVGDTALPAPLPPDEGLIRLDPTTVNQVRMLLEPTCGRTIAAWLKQAALPL